MESEKSLQKDDLGQLHEKIFQELKEWEEQKSKEVLQVLGHKHNLGNLKKERDRARMLQGKELPVAEGDFIVATGGSSFRSCSPSLALDVDEGVSTPSRRSPSLGRTEMGGALNWRKKWSSWRCKEPSLLPQADP